VDDKILFAGVEDSVGLEVWSTDGVIAGATQLTDGLDVDDEGLNGVAIF